MSERSHDTLAGILVAAVCAAYLKGARDLESPLVADPLGPSAFPIILGWVGLFLAGVLVVRAWAVRPEAAEAPARRSLKPFLLFALFLGYVLAFEIVGYVPATFLFVLLGMLTLGEPLWRGAVIAGGFSVTFYYLFAHVLKISLPVGELFRGW